MDAAVARASPDATREPDAGVPLERRSDESLARAAALGDRDAFEVVVRRHGPALHRYARRTLLDDGDTQEAVQDAFIAAWQRLPQWRGDSALRTWLFSITAHKAADLRRRRRPVPVPGDDLLDLPAGRSADPERRAAGTSLAAALELELARLPERQRSVWVLREIEQLSHAEICEVLGMGPDTERGLLARARRTLSERMSSWR